MCINAVKLSWRIQQDFSRRLFRRVDKLCTCSFQQVTWSSHGSQITFDFVNRIKFFFLYHYAFFFYMSSLKKLQTPHFNFFFLEKKIMKSRYIFFSKEQRIFIYLSKNRSNKVRLFHNICAKCKMYMTRMFE